MNKETKKFARTRFANISPIDEVAKPCAQDGCSFECDLCEYSCSTFQRLSLHKFKRHGIKNIWRLYVGSFTHCNVCLKQFWTRERLLNHVRYRSKICKHNLQLRGPVCDIETAEALDSADAETNADLYRKGLRRHNVDDPVVQLSGPVLPIVPIDCFVQSKHRLGNGHNRFC